MPGGYALRARLLPAALLVAPTAALLIALGISPSGQGTIAAGALGALALIVAGLAADRGRDLEKVLFNRWGGAPTTQRLRWRDANAATVSSRHDSLRAIAPVTLPNAADERADPVVADQRYGDAVAAVRSVLREAEIHRILADSNAEYGFRRNCLAVRVAGTAIAVVATIAGVVLWTLGAGGRPTGFLVAAVASAGIAAVWMQVVTEDWVRSAAERYGDQFFTTARGYQRAQ